MSSAARTTGSAPIIESPAIGPKKTLFVMVTVIGCIAILWPKVFYPMMMAPAPAKNIIKDHRGSGCCDVVLDTDSKYANTSLEIIGTQQSYRKRLNLITGEISIRQERPPHLRQELVHPAMKERGRAISTPTVPITDRPHNPPPIIVEGRPGPIPGMRPPLGSAGGHQAQQKQSSMGFIMPLYTIGIVSFFIYTIMKLVFKKPTATVSPYEKVEPDPAFRNEVFTQNGSYFKRPDDGTTKLGLHHQHLHHHLMHENGGGDVLNQNGHYYGTCGGVSDGNIESFSCKLVNDLLTSSIASTPATATTATATTANDIKNDLCDDDKCKKLSNGKHVDFKLGDDNDNVDNLIANGQEVTSITTTGTLITANNNQLLELDLLRKKLEETERAMAKIISQMGTVPPKGQEMEEINGNEIEGAEKENKDDEKSLSAIKEEVIVENKKIETNSERDKGTVKVLGMEMTASCENGKKWSRPSTPVTASTPYVPIKEPVHQLEDEPIPQSIYLQGALPHESQILVSDAETYAEEIVDDDLDGTADDPAVVLSGKMTLSLINLDHIERDALIDHLSHKKENGFKTNGHTTDEEVENEVKSTKISSNNVGDNEE